MTTRTSKRPNRATKLSDVAVKNTRIVPLGVWKYLARNQQPERSEWPSSSLFQCWWCAHTFENVPAFLPVDYDEATGAFLFSGNFCSWNCVKTYALQLEKNRHAAAPPACSYIGLLAFLTVIKPMKCISSDLHELGLCDCVAEYRGVGLAKSREVLKSFGGTVSIDDFRRGFHAISSHAAVMDLFLRRDVITKTMARARRLPTTRYWGFHKLHYDGPEETYATWISILPFTNRTLDKSKLIQTGSEESGIVESGDARSNHHATVETKASASAPRLSRRARQAGQPLPVSTTKATAAAPAPIMTSDETMACNDEQVFYTRSLRGYGNLLTCMGITINKGTSS